MITILLPVLTLLLGVFTGYWLGQQAKNKEITLLREKFEAKQREAELLASDKESLRTQLSEQSEKAVRAESVVALLKETDGRYQQLQQQYLAAEKSLATVKAQLDQAEMALAAQKEDILKMQEQNRTEFRNMATEILGQKEKAFTETNDKHLQQLLNPLREQLGDFKKKVEEVYIAESKERHTLEAEIKRLVATSNQVGQEANNLTNALKTNVKKQGNWGELLLESILTNSGLTKGREFVLQQFIRDKAGNMIKDSEGNGLQPDAMILYPDERIIIADSKVSLVAWDRYCNTEDPAEQKKALEEHIRSVYAHIDGLSAKNYPKYAKALEYVLMFVPIEPAFLEALKADQELWKYAYDKGIVMVSPTNLLAVLKIIADLWKVELQSKNAIDIAEKAGSLYDKFYGFMENFKEVGKKIEDAHKVYDKAFKQLYSGNGNIIRRVAELRDMGVKTKNQLSDELLKLAEEAEEEPVTENPIQTN